MYVDPFWAGVLTTIFAELLVLFLMAVFSVGGKDDRSL